MARSGILTALAPAVQARRGDSSNDLLRACVSLDPASRPTLDQVRTALDPLRSPAPTVDHVVASVAAGR